MDKRTADGVSPRHDVDVAGEGVARRRVVLGLADARLVGDLATPPRARGLVVFAASEGRDRRSPRHRAVARSLERAGFATLLLDLLTPDEAAAEAAAMSRAFRVDALAARLADATAPALAAASRGSMPVGYFGAGGAAAVALAAAALRPGVVRAVVAAGGRLDHVAEALGRLDAPTLLVVASDDPVAVARAREAAPPGSGRAVACVEGASHLLAEPATLASVGALAAEWFGRHLPAPVDDPIAWGPGGPARCEVRGHGRRARGR